MNKEKYKNMNNPFYYTHRVSKAGYSIVLDSHRYLIIQILN